MDNETAKNDHFIRQRRNLILISVFIIFMQVVGLEVDKISFLGNSAEITNSDKFPFMVFTIFIYFLWRYYTACREVTGWRQFKFDISSRATNLCVKNVDKAINRKKRSYIMELSAQAHDRDRLFPVILVKVVKRGARKLYKETGKINALKWQNTRIKIKWHHCFNVLYSGVDVILTTSKFSEYVLPYLLSVLAVLEFFDVGLVSGVFNCF